AHWRGELPSVPAILHQRKIGGVKGFLADCSRKLQAIGSGPFEIRQLNGGHQRLADDRERGISVPKAACAAVNQGLVDISLSLRQGNAGEFLAVFGGGDEVNPGDAEAESLVAADVN